MNISDRDRKFLWTRAGNRCSYSYRGKKCNIKLLTHVNGRLTAIGDECYIVGETPKDSRYVDAFPQRITYYNLILLCKEHHTLIDSDPNIYTVKMLHEMKDAHEAEVEKETKKDAHTPPVRTNDDEIIKAVKRAQREAGM
ncbi:MAG: hypothetical protein WC455_07515 [Dehalococcoidia bacterium]|jgi:hypothetical protein